MLPSGSQDVEYSVRLSSAVIEAGDLIPQAGAWLLPDVFGVATTVGTDPPAVTVKVAVWLAAQEGAPATGSRLTVIVCGPNVASDGTENVALKL